MSAFTDASFRDMARAVGWVPVLLMLVGVCTLAKWTAYLIARVLFGPRATRETPS